jgi:PAS domain S-box-containing protein
MGKIQKLEQERQALQLENEVLRNFVDTSKDALFCIEFLEPVDLTAPEPEIVRQTFENECVWRMCNNAMARLYKLPEGQDFNAQNVHFVFAHNPENEEFVRTLIKAEFNIDGVVSLDGDYDGHEVHMENDIRGVITDGMLHRMIGAVRNISERKKREQALTERLTVMSNVLSAIPDPVLVVDTDGVLQAVNPALEWKFGWHLDDILGQPISTVIHFPDNFSLAGELPLPGADAPRLNVEVLSPNGRLHRCGAQVSSFGDDGNDRRIVITLRSEKTSSSSMSHEYASERVSDDTRSTGAR